MPKYIHKPIEIEAVQWFKIGDHLDVEKYNLGSECTCLICGNSYNNHGIVTFEKAAGVGKCVCINASTYRLTCPGDWVVTDNNGGVSVVSGKQFREMYEDAK